MLTTRSHLGEGVKKYPDEFPISYRIRFTTCRSYKANKIIIEKSWKKAGAELYQAQGKLFLPWLTNTIWIYQFALWIQQDLSLKSKVFKLERVKKKICSKNLGSRKFFVQKFLGPILLSPKQNFGPKQFSVQKYLGPKQFCIQNILGTKIFWVQKKLGPKKFWVQKNFGSKNFGSKNFLGPTKFLVKKNF